MNNKGQSLVIFVILIPLIIISCALVIDTATMITEKNRLDSICKEAIDYVLLNDKSYDDVYRFIKKNDADIEIVKLEITDKIIISLKKESPGYFGSVIGFDNYEYLVAYEGYLKKGKVVYKEKG